MFLILLSFLLGVLVGGYVLYRTFLKTVSNNAPLHVVVPTLKKGAATNNLLGDPASPPRKIHLTTPRKRKSSSSTTEEPKVLILPYFSLFCCSFSSF